MSSVLLTVGVFLLGFALRSFGAVWARKTGALAILAGSFLGAYFLGEKSIAAGLTAVAVWFLLPWIEILGRVRHLRLPLRRAVEPCAEPPRGDFPHLGRITREIEEAGYVQHSDLGWEHGEFSQFLRTFLDPENRTVAAVSLSRQGPHAFVHVSLTTRDEHGKVFRTTNLPFSDTMAVPPDVIWQRDLKAGSFVELAAGHGLFLSRAGAKSWLPVKAEEIPAMLEADVARQIDHNLHRGIIRPADATTFRYSWRGFVFLWWRLIADMIRLA